jgi:hypothetical protein
LSSETHGKLSLFKLARWYGVNAYLHSQTCEKIKLSVYLCTEMLK